MGLALQMLSFAENIICYPVKVGAVWGGHGDEECKRRQYSLSLSGYTVGLACLETFSSPTSIG